MSKTINCAVCGQPFLAKTRGKYCPNCRDAAIKARKSETEKRRREKKRDANPLPKVATGDTPEQIQSCLNCKKKTCTGFCETIREVKNK